MANKQPEQQKCEKSRGNSRNNSKPTKLLVMQNGNSEREDHVNGIESNSLGESSHRNNNIHDDLSQLRLEDDVSFSPDQNGIRLLEHNHGMVNSSGAIPKCPIFRKLKKQYSGEKHKDQPNIVNGSCDSITKVTKKYKKHNSACCDIFCGHPRNPNLNDEDGTCSVYEQRDNSPGWNDVNGGGMGGFLNPNMQHSQERENGSLERNFFSDVNPPNVHETVRGRDNLDELSSVRIPRDISDGGLSEMIDEGAVCDFDRLQHLEYEEMYDVDNLEIEEDHDFDELESPDLLFPSLSNPSYSRLRLMSPRQSSEMNNTPSNDSDSGAAAQAVSVHWYRTVRCEDQVVQDPNFAEDTGDFIDTDLPSKASGPNSSESLSGSDDDLIQEPFENIPPDPRNDLSSNRASSNFGFFPLVSDCPSHVDGRENCLLVNNGSNFDNDKDENLYLDDKLLLVTHDDSDNSSGSENGENIEDILFEPCPLRFGESCEQILGSPNHPRGAVGYSSRTSCFSDHLDDHGMNASGGAFTCEKVSNSLLPPVCRCPVLNSSCTAPSNVNIGKNPSSGSENSNLQSDESNKKQKIFNKFPILLNRQSCGSQAAQRTSNCNMLSCDKEANLPHGNSHSSDMSSYQQLNRHLSLAANCEPSTSECGVSEPIYEEANESSEQLEDYSKMGASGGFTEKYKNNIDSDPKPVAMPVQKKSVRQRERKSSSGRPQVEKVMIWSEYEAYMQQVKQIGLSACGPTAVINVLKALDMNIDKEEVSRVIRAKLRMEDAPIPTYLFSRAVAGTEASDLLVGVETLTKGKLRGRFFKFWPPRDVHLVKWLGHWMKKGAVPLATLNLQRGVASYQPIPDAWHHQMVYGVSSKDVYLTNPQEKVPEEIIMEQLTSDSILLINRQDIVQRFQESDLDLRPLLRQADDRWCTMNVLGQVVNVLREEGLANNPGYRTQLTSHISIPAVYETGITLFVQSNTETWSELKSAEELPLKQDT